MAAKPKLTRRDHAHIAACRSIRRKVSQKAVAARLGVHVNTVKHIERYGGTTVEDFQMRHA